VVARRPAARSLARGDVTRPVSAPEPAARPPPQPSDRLALPLAPANAAINCPSGHGQETKATTVSNVDRIPARIADNAERSPPKERKKAARLVIRQAPYIANKEPRAPLQGRRAKRSAAQLLTMSRTSDQSTSKGASGTPPRPTSIPTSPGAAGNQAERGWRTTPTKSKSEAMSGKERSAPPKKMRCTVVGREPIATAKNVLVEEVKATPRASAPASSRPRAEGRGRRRELRLQRQADPLRRDLLARRGPRTEANDESCACELETEGRGPRPTTRAAPATSG